MEQLYDELNAKVDVRVYLVGQKFGYFNIKLGFVENFVCNMAFLKTFNNTSCKIFKLNISYLNFSNFKRKQNFNETI